MSAQLSCFREYAVHISCAEGDLRGDLIIPAGAAGLVVFAHGSGSSRLSPRNRLVADVMHKYKLATLLVDLLTPWEVIAEEKTGALRFNIPLITSRLASAIRWVERNPDTRNFTIGVYGSSTGAAAALCAAVRMPEIKALVLRGGRTDLAENAPDKVTVPTLLIVGEDDRPVVAWNEETFHRLSGIKNLVHVTGATHLFHEPGALEEVAECASSWFEHYLAM